MKDKEHQIKYYRSYPKPPILDMKRENSDISVVEPANIPKFSKLDDIVTPLRHFKLFFDDVLADMIVSYTNLYSHGKEAEISLEITKEKMQLCLSMLLLSGRRKLPDLKMYRKRIRDTLM